MEARKRDNEWRGYGTKEDFNCTLFRQVYLLMGMSQQMGKN
jgi:hypothetical protein